MKPKKLCNQPGCKTLIDYNLRYCGKHKKESSLYNYQQRKALDEKYLVFYNSKEWRKASELYRLNNGLCEDCLENNVIRKADVVDHEKELKDRWDLRLEETNFRSLCHMHHNIKTARERAKRTPKSDGGSVFL